MAVCCLQGMLTHSDSPTSLRLSLVGGKVGCVLAKTVVGRRQGSCVLAKTVVGRGHGMSGMGADSEASTSEGTKNSNNNNRQLKQSHANI